MGEQRLINKNPYLYGPGPIKRVPTGTFSYFGRVAPLQGFSSAAMVGVAIALTGSFTFKWFFGDPQIRAIENYYKENPPR